MSIPDTTRDDIEDGVPIDMAARVIQYRTFDDGNTLTKIEDMEGNRLDFKIWAGDHNPDVLEEGHWFLLEDAEGDTYPDPPMIDSNGGDVEITPIDAPEGVEEQSEPEVTNADGGVLAFDIETVTIVPEEEFDFETDQLELLSIGVGFSADGNPPAEMDVLIRAGDAVEDEVALLEAFCEYVAQRQPDQLLLFKGLDFDKYHLLGRADLAGGQDLHDRVQALFDDHDLRNLNPLGSLEDNADVEPTYWDVYNHTLDPADWRVSHPNWDDDKPVDQPKIENTDIPFFGERYLELVDDVDDPRRGGPELRALRELIVHYTRADIEPLFSLN